ncbi:glycoside hydrolase superfamily [Hyaloraphidium curvatum]|nr:glycoside hydrolase superfamily [Hyaloraphidium curvatum]
MAARFVSWNVPNLHLVEDPWFARVTEWEQRDALTAVAQMGGGVARIYALSVRRPGDAASLPRHVNAAGQLDEDLMRDLDRALALAGELGVRLIVPFLDHWQWWGSTGDFARLVAPSARDDDFYTNDAVVSAFRGLVSSVLLRNNTVTGRQYRLDPSILAWETGNELSYAGGPPPAAWTLGVARHIRSLSPLSSQLIIDGTFSKYGWASLVWSSAEVDGVTGHYYPLPVSDSVPVGQWLAVGILSLLGIAAIVCLALRKKIGAKFPEKSHQILTASFAFALFVSLLGLGLLAWNIVTLINTPISAQFRADMSVLKSRNASKVFYVGEFGFRPAAEMEDLLKAIVDEPRCLGGLAWSLRFRSSQGGFFTHKEREPYAAYHHPGISPNPPAGFPADSPAINSLMRTYAARIRGLAEAIALPIPAAPTALAATLASGSRVELRWRGSVGARSYTVERNGNGTWVLLASAVYENQAWGEPGYVDATGAAGVGSSYRIRAENEAGVSPWSAAASV